MNPIVLMIVGAALATAAACRQDAPGPTGAPADLESWLQSGRVVDLTHPLSPESLFWPTGQPFEHRRLAWGPTPAGYWYAAAEFSSPEHLGTHLDAPIHFAERGWASADVPVERLVAPGAVIDISGRAAAEPDATLEAADLDTWEREHGALAPGAIVLVRTGWSARWPDWNRYYGSSTPRDVATLHFPGVSAEGARALIGRGAVGVGIDTASIDPGRSTTFEAHQVLAGANLFNLENLTGLEGLPAKGFVVMALPMKIAGGTGGPARVVALIPKG
jgi:kynurenine formamidase